MIIAKELQKKIDFLIDMYNQEAEDNLKDLTKVKSAN